VISTDSHTPKLLGSTFTKKASGSSASTKELQIANIVQIKSKNFV
jgi:histidinol phosphatase-like PHP family hydrolase